MNEMLAGLQPFWLGILIGFIIGLERERAHGSDVQAFGLRTFSLIGFLGAFAGTDIPVFLAALTTVFVLSAILLGYWRSTQQNETSDVGFTTEISAFCVFSLGYLSVHQPLVAVILGAFVLALLAGREWLHKFTRQRITQQEADALISLIVVGAGILPLLPREALDPWGLFVPFKLGSLVLALALVQFLSYVLLKFFGRRAGFLLGGFLAGLVSSTAAYAHIREALKNESSVLIGMISYGIMSIAATTVVSVVIIYLSSLELLRSLAWNFALVLIAIALISASSFIATRKLQHMQHSPQDPLNWKSQIKFAVVLFLIIAFTKAATDFIGQEALWLVSFLSGLFELQVVTFALSASEKFSEQIAIAMALAYVGSLVSKMVLITTAPQADFSAKKSHLFVLLLLIVCFVGPFFF